MNSETVIESLMEGLLLKEGASRAAGIQQRLPGMGLDAAWDLAAEREKKSRTVFAQYSIHPDEVMRELLEVQGSIGSSADVERFMRTAVAAHGGRVTGERPVTLDLTSLPPLLKETLGEPGVLRARFDPPLAAGETHLLRTHSVVSGLAAHVLDTALDPLESPVARRTGALRTRIVSRRTTLVIARIRYHVIRQDSSGEVPLLAEEALTAAFAGSPSKPEWIQDTQVIEALLDAAPDANVSADQARDFVQKALDELPAWMPHVETLSDQRAQALLESHRRVRDAAKVKRVTFRVEAQRPPDLLGVYVFLPLAPGAAV